MSPPRPALVCDALLAALDASEGRRRRRKRDTTPDAIGMSLKRRLLAEAREADPDPDAFEAWLLASFTRKVAARSGYFQVTADVAPWTKAAFLSQVGKRTPVVARFSTVAGEQGYADTDRDPRGFALKFYTEEGNYDLVGNNTPVFFVRAPSKFQDFIHSQKRMPDTGLLSSNMQWDFWSLSPESLHQVVILMSDRGTPRTWRRMNGYGSHTFMWINAAGKRVWVKYHFKTEQGIQNFTAAQAKAMQAEDPGYHRRDLYQAIEKKNYPAWRLEMQIMPFEDAATYGFNPFDLTKVWPHRDYRRSPSVGSSSTAIPRISLPRSSRRHSRRRTWCRGSGPARTGCCSGGCSATTTRICTASGRTTSSCRSTARAARCTATTRTARCATRTVATSPSMRRIGTVGPRPIPSALPIPGGWWRGERSCAAPRRATQRTTTSSRRATSTAT